MALLSHGTAKNVGQLQSVQDQLKNVQQIQASDYDFTTIMGDGSVVIWDSKECGATAVRARPAQERATDPSLRLRFYHHHSR